MKRSAQKDTNFSDKHKSEFLYFILTLLFKAKLKIWRFLKVNANISV